ncbi:flavin reductase family protein [Nonomuraea sp. B10E15]|uniref:flavin reductase family protein n=1 Tax=Nonomuraea sp. B10E15 TaxID=3153560 RepID=UPI00325C78B7
MTADLAPADADFRRTMGCFATGVAVVTVGGPEPHGMTANSITSVSLHPPTILVCVGRNASMHARLMTAGCFGVSVLAGDQERYARAFADRARPRGRAQFAGVPHRAGPSTGAPVLDGTAAWVECELIGTHAVGDHSIFIGSVLDLGFSRRPPLVFWSGGYVRLPVAVDAGGDTSLRPPT